MTRDYLFYKDTPVSIWYNVHLQVQRDAIHNITPILDISVQLLSNNNKGLEDRVRIQDDPPSASFPTLRANWMSEDEKKKQRIDKMSDGDRVM